jgi:CheY-like chemotaxis protein
LLVLYVDDDRINRMVMQAMLRRVDITLDEASDGLEGLEKIEQSDYDVVLMDLRMPNMDGLTAIGHIRARGDGKAHTPVVVVTADNSDSTRSDCLEQGANDVLYKPVSLERMIEVLATFAG